MNPSEEEFKSYQQGQTKVSPVVSEVTCRTEECEMELNIGVFMDGTKNKWVEEGQAQTQLQRQKDSNVYRLLVAAALAASLLILSACKAQTYTPEDLASHEAYLEAAAVCARIADDNKRADCWDEAPIDWTDADPNGVAGVPLTGIDHLAEHLSVQEFSVDGASGAQAGKGGSIVCCAKLPNRWRPDQMMEVRWNVTNWRDCTGAEHVRRIPVERYVHADRLYVHFMADGSVKLVSSRVGPLHANAPDSKYPIKDPIPDKYPWSKYPYETTCKNKIAVAKERQ